MYQPSNPILLEAVSPRRTKPIGPLTIAVARVLRDIRESIPMTQADVVQQTGLSASALHRIETADQDITVDHLATLAKCYKTTARAIVIQAAPERGDVTVETDDAVDPQGSPEPAPARRPAPRSRRGRR